MFLKNKLISNIPRGPVQATKLSADSIDTTPQITFTEDHDFNFQVAYVYKFESPVHDNAIKKLTINGLHSGIADTSLAYIETLLYYLTSMPSIDMYETRKLLVYDKKEGI